MEDIEVVYNLVIYGRSPYIKVSDEDRFTLVILALEGKLSIKGEGAKIITPSNGVKLMEPAIEISKNRHIIDNKYRLRVYYSWDGF